MPGALVAACDRRNLQDANEVKKHLGSLGLICPDKEAYSRIITCLNSVYNTRFSVEDLSDIVTESSSDGGIDAIVFTGESVDIFEIKRSANLGLKEIRDLENRIEHLFFKNDMPSPIEDDWKSLENNLKKYYSTDNTRSKLRIFIARESFTVFSNEIKATIQRIESKDSVEVILLDEVSIADRMLEQDFLKEWKLTRLHCRTLDSTALEGAGKDKYHALILRIPLTHLLKLYEKHIDEKKDLFAMNIRLPKKSIKFSDGLKETLINRGSDFYLFHNGITITAAEICGKATYYSILEPQIVNGAQSVENIFRLFQTTLDSALFSSASVLCKIVQADPDTVSEICETSNTQRAVKVEDLRTNDVFQKQLEVFINNDSDGRYSYSRKGETPKQRGSKKIKYTTFFQWAYSALERKPAAAKNSKGILFETDARGEYANIKKKILANLKHIITLCEIGLFVEEKIKGMTIKTKKGVAKKGLARDMNLHIVGGLYLKQVKRKKTKINLDKNFDTIFKLLKEHYEMKHRSDDSLDSGRFFTKSETAWEYLENKLK